MQKEHNIPHQFQFGTCCCLCSRPRHGLYWPCLPLPIQECVKNAFKVEVPLQHILLPPVMTWSQIWWLAKGIYSLVCDMNTGRDDLSSLHSPTLILWSFDCRHYTIISLFLDSVHPLRSNTQCHSQSLGKTTWSDVDTQGDSGDMCCTVTGKNSFSQTNVSMCLLTLVRSDHNLTTLVCASSLLTSCCMRRVEVIW
jgi:hypothetical protein